MNEQIYNSRMMKPSSFGPSSTGVMQNVPQPNGQINGYPPASLQNHPGRVPPPGVSNPGINSAMTSSSHSSGTNSPNMMYSPQNPAAGPLPRSTQTVLQPVQNNQYNAPRPLAQVANRNQVQGSSMNLLPPPFPNQNIASTPSPVQSFGQSGITPPSGQPIGSNFQPILSSKPGPQPNVPSNYSSVPNRPPNSSQNEIVQPGAPNSQFTQPYNNFMRPPNTANSESYRQPSPTAGQYSYNNASVNRFPATAGCQSALASGPPPRGPNSLTSVGAQSVGNKPNLSHPNNVSSSLASPNVPPHVFNSSASGPNARIHHTQMVTDHWRHHFRKTDQISQSQTGVEIIEIFYCKLAVSVRGNPKYCIQVPKYTTYSYTEGEEDPTPNISKIEPNYSLPSSVSPSSQPPPSGMMQSNSLPAVSSSCSMPTSQPSNFTGMPNSIGGQPQPRMAAPALNTYNQNQSRTSQFMSSQASARPPQYGRNFGSAGSGMHPDQLASRVGSMNIFGGSEAFNIMQNKNVLPETALPVPRPAIPEHQSNCSPEIGVWADGRPGILVPEPAEMALAPLLCHVGHVRRSAVLREHVVVSKCFGNPWQNIFFQTISSGFIRQNNFWAPSGTAFELSAKNLSFWVFATASTVKIFLSDQKKTLTTPTLEATSLVQNPAFLRATISRRLLAAILDASLADQRIARRGLIVLTNIPEEFLFDPVSKQYGDPSRRPEVNVATVEFIAPSEYMLRPPQPAVYLYLLDVTRNALATGYLDIFCKTLLTEIDNIPGDARTQIGFIAFDSCLHFYNLSERQAQPQMMTVSDIDGVRERERAGNVFNGLTLWHIDVKGPSEVEHLRGMPILGCSVKNRIRLSYLVVLRSTAFNIFLPLPEGLLVNIHESKELVKDLLTKLPSMFEGSLETQNALGAVLQVAYKLLAPTGGRISVLQTSLPSIGPGKLKSREDPNQRAAKDIQNLGPANDFYKKLALEFSGQQIAVDLFILSSQYTDIATLSCVSKFSGGCMYHYPGFQATANLSQSNRFKIDLQRYINRKIGFEAVMRIRCTKGISIHTFHGDFFVRSTDLLSLPNINPDAAFGMHMSLEESLSDCKTVCFQAALLYTSTAGERRIRVHTMCLPVTTSISDVISNADQQAIAGLVAKMAVDRSLNSSMSDAREALLNVSIDACGAFQQISSSQPSGALMVPLSIRLLPLYTLAILKSVSFRVGTSTKLDERVFAMNLLKTLPLDQLILMVYPEMYPVHALGNCPKVEYDNSEVAQPPLLHLSSERTDQNGAYLMHTGRDIYLYVCGAISDSFCQNVLGVPCFAAISEEMFHLPELENVESKMLRAFIKDDSRLKLLFLEHIIEDRSESTYSYYEFLQHIQQQVCK
ncbi:Protein transport protein Sec24B [Nymphon striatum]|nr:Protein transport protein Sec24B [Nymphon striatum]